MIDIEILTQLNPNGIDPYNVPGGHPGDITPDTIRAALAGSTRAEYGLALYMVGDKQARGDVFAGHGPAYLFPGVRAGTAATR